MRLVEELLQSARTFSSTRSITMSICILWMNRFHFNGRAIHLQFAILFYSHFFPHSFYVSVWFRRQNNNKGECVNRECQSERRAKKKKRFFFAIHFVTRVFVHRQSSSILVTFIYLPFNSVLTAQLNFPDSIRICIAECRSTSSTPLSSTCI